jgi:GntR family transcriptional regulator
VTLRVAADSPVPPYEQIRQQVVDMAAAGVLAEGSQLPPIRQLARDLGLASGTVARAYRELEAEGVIESRGRRGTFIRSGSPAERGNADDLVEEAARSFALRVQQLGVDPDTAVRALRRAYEEAAPG